MPVDVFVDMTDPDASTAAMILQVGIWDGASANLSSAAAGWRRYLGTTTAVTADSSQRLTRNRVCMENVTPVNADRKIGVKVQTAPPRLRHSRSLGSRSCIAPRNWLVDVWPFGFGSDGCSVSLRRNHAGHL